MVSVKSKKKSFYTLNKSKHFHKYTIKHMFLRCNTILSRWHIDFSFQLLWKFNSDTISYRVKMSRSVQMPHGMKTRIKLLWIMFCSDLIVSECAVSKLRFLLVWLRPLVTTKHGEGVTGEAKKNQNVLS
jgi:hypothetical protein